LVRDDAEEFEALALEAAPGEVGDVLEFFGEDLVEDDPDDLDTLGLEEGAVHGDFVDGETDATAGDDDDLGSEEFGDGGVGEVEDGADAGVAGALDEDELLFPGDAVEGLVDPLDEGIEIGVLEVAPGEVWFDSDGRHVDERAVEPEDVVHEDGVLIDLLFVDFYEALSDGLDVADSAVAAFEGGEESEGGGGFAVVLPGGGDENARGDFVEEHVWVCAQGCGSEFAWQVFTGTGVELLVFDGLEADDGGDAEDVVGIGTTGDIGGGAVQAEEDLAVGVGAGDVLDELGGDVA
jgi:hypothetical protein